MLEAISFLQILQHVCIRDGWVRGPPKTEHFPARDAIGPLKGEEVGKEREGGRQGGGGELRERRRRSEGRALI